MELRVATVIAIYHLWERHIPNPSKRRRVHSQLIADARAHSIDLHADIDTLCFAANYLKHGTEQWRKQLVNLYPARFSFSASHTEAWPAAFRKLYLRDTDITWFIEIAAISQRAVTTLG